MGRAPGFHCAGAYSPTPAESGVIMSVATASGYRALVCYNPLLKISTRGTSTMATVNFSIPEEIKEAFQKTFSKENRSAIIARLMQEAVEERQREQRRAAAIDAVLELRRRQVPASDAEIAEARRAGRP